MSLNHLGPLAELAYLDKTIRFLEIICVELSKVQVFILRLIFLISINQGYHEEEIISEKNLKMH